MRIQTVDGVEINVLPETARCLETGMRPEDMNKCPICNFEDEGDICIPDSCTCYTEEQKETQNQLKLEIAELKRIIDERDEKIRTHEKAITDLEAENMTLKRDKDRLAEEANRNREMFRTVYDLHIDVMERMMEKL